MKFSIKYLVGFVFILSISAFGQIPKIKLHPEGFDSIQVEIKDSVKVYYKLNYIEEWEKQAPALKGSGTQSGRKTIGNNKIIFEKSFLKRNLPWYLTDGTQENVNMDIDFMISYLNNKLTFNYKIKNIFNKRLNNYGPEIYFEDETTVYPHNLQAVTDLEDEVNALAQSFFQYIQNDLTGVALSNKLYNDAQELYQDEKYDKGLTLFQKAIEADSTNYYAYLGESRSYYQLDKKEIALRKLIELTRSEKIQRGFKFDLYRFIAGIYETDYNDKQKAYDALMASRKLNLQITEEIENLENTSFFSSSLNLWEESYLKRAYAFYEMGYDKEAREDFNSYEALLEKRHNNLEFYEELVNYYKNMQYKQDALRILDKLIEIQPNRKAEFENQKNEISK